MRSGVDRPEGKCGFCGERRDDVDCAGDVGV